MSLAVGINGAIPSRARRRNRAYVPAVFGAFQLVLLVGYAFLGRGFAYVGFPPIFVGEIGLFLAVAAILTSLGRFKHTLWRCPVSWLLILFIAWGAACTYPYLDLYGGDALRDGVIWGYALYAVAVALTVLQFDDKIDRVIAWYGRAVPMFLVVSPILFFIAQYAPSVIPHWPWGPGGGVLLVDQRLGHTGMHYAGIFSFIVMGLAPTAVSLWWIVVWFAGVTPAVVLSRGALVTVSAVATATALLRPAFKYYIVLFVIVSTLGMLSISGLDILIPRPGGENYFRSISVNQLVDDIESIAGVNTGEIGSDLLGTKRWREEWWDRILSYTINGDYFWTGRGFGINLADSDGFQTEEDHSLRSPHDIHMTILARTGVPGLMIWLSLQAAFAIALFFTFLKDFRSGRRRLATIEIWVLLYWLAFLINASFDVVLEGPQDGIWFWSIFGFGLALISLPASTRRAFSQRFASSNVGRPDTDRFLPHGS
jgi:hypothetical protein